MKAAFAQYLVACQGGSALAPDPTASAFPAYLQWVHYGEGMIMGPMSNYVVETGFLPPERRSDEHVKRAMKLTSRAVQAVDDHMDGRDYLAGDFTAADTITGHACYMARRIGVDTSGMPRLDDYIDRLLARPALPKALDL